MKHLRISHILNVSNKIPNHFEESSKNLQVIINIGSLNIEYLKINIEDHDSV